jgi:hypothetical protein
MSEFDFGAEYAAFGDDLKGVSFEGEYDMVVQKAVAGTTQKGKQQFTLTLGFTSGPYKAKNKTVIDRLIWSPESDVAARIFSSSLKILGASHEWIMSARPSPAQIAERITGTVVSVRLRPDEFNGQPTTRVSYLSSVSVKDGGNAGAAKAAKAVSLEDESAPDTVVTPTAAAPADDESSVDKATGEVKEPATAGAGASSGTENPWA